MGNMEKALWNLADACLEAGERERPEKQWLGRMYDRFREANRSLGKAEADELIYMKMYAQIPGKPSDTLKIRYWRTGRHLPVSREQCLSFGKALDLSEEEMRYLIQGYYDRSDRVFETEQEGGAYGRRIGLLNELIQEYLDKVHPVIRHRLYRSGADLEHSLRHIYYTDARSYLDAREPDQTEVKQHIASINYVSEFGRQMKLLGEIPRKTMIRHLLLFAVPFVSRELLSSRLEAFGYLPLQDTHTQVDGSRLDRLILGFLELYEENCSGKDPESCSRWFREAYGILDRYLEKRGNTSLRFLYFKALKGSE